MRPSATVLRRRCGMLPIRERGGGREKKQTMNWKTHRSSTGVGPEARWPHDPCQPLLTAREERRLLYCQPPPTDKVDMTLGAMISPAPYCKKRDRPTGESRAGQGDDSFRRGCFGAWALVKVSSCRETPLTSKRRAGAAKGYIEPQYNGSAADRFDRQQGGNVVGIRSHKDEMS